MKTAPGTSLTRPSIANTAGARRCGAARASPTTRRRRTTSIATGDRRVPPEAKTSSPPAFLRRLSEGVLRLSDVVEGELAGFHEARHDGLRAAIEEREQIIHECRVRLVPRNDGLEDVGVADPLDAAQRLLLFQPVDHRLDRRERGSAFFGKRLVDLPHRAAAGGPERLH